MRVGAAVVDVTPPFGHAMAGFGARTLPATATHDPITARAVVVDDTALAVADVIGLDAATCRRVRQRCRLPAERVIVAALHGHGGPASMPGRAGGGTDPDYMARLEDGLVAAIDRAAAAARPARLSAGLGDDPDVARNRRRADGPLDRAVPLLRFDDAATGRPIALVTGYACHPVVLGADNLAWTADYPNYVRQTLEDAHPGAVALFATGPCGDANTGHSAAASLTTSAQSERTFARAEALGRRIGAAALAARLAPCGNRVAAAETTVTLTLARRESETPAALAAAWRAEGATAAPMRRLILDHWIRWAETIAPAPLTPLTERVAVLDWGGVPAAGLPGEIFAATGLAVRAAFGGAPGLVVAYADDNPGYIPAEEDYARGGYEVDEAHRYYGLPASFAPGSAETLAAAARRLLGDVASQTRP
jgi:hypothetical protein